MRCWKCNEDLCHCLNEPEIVDNLLEKLQFIIEKYILLNPEILNYENIVSIQMGLTRFLFQKLAVIFNPI